MLVWTSPEKWTPIGSIMTQRGVYGQEGNDPGIPTASLVDIDLETGRSLKPDVLLAEALHWTIE